MRKQMKRRIMALSAALLLSSVLSTGVFAKVEGENYPITESKSGTIGSMSVHASSEIKEKSAIAITSGSQTTGQKSVTATYKYINYISGKQTTTTNGSGRVGVPSVEVRFTAPEESYYRSWYLGAEHFASNNGTLNLYTAVQKK